MAPRLLAAILLPILPLAHAASTNTTDDCNYTPDPSTKYSWYTAPPLRGTTDILWSCLSTLFICLWAALHLNVPSPTDTPRTITLRKIQWMVVGILAPEILTFLAFAQWNDARRFAKRMQSLGHPWTISHGFFANMGGFVTTSEDGTQPHALTALELYRHVRNGVLPCPETTEREIMDKSKADTVVKGIACVQATWLVLQCIARGVQGLSLSTLEVVTMAYVLCTLATYCCWWSKPLDVMVPIQVGTLDRVEKRRDRISNKKVFITLDDSLEEFEGYRGPLLENVAPLGGVAAGILFGCLHCIAWDFYFPSDTERMLWRLSSIMMIVFVPAYISLVVFISMTDGSVGRACGSDCMFGWVLALGVLVYVPTRVFLVVEPFTALRSVPGDVYQTVEWTGFIPHI